MTRLPIPGSDSGSWGNLLNDFLLVEHEADGSLKKSADIAEAKSKAYSAVQSVNGVSPVEGDVSLTAAHVGALPDTYAPDWSTVTNKPALGTAATADVSDFQSDTRPSYASSVKAWDSIKGTYNLRSDNALRWRAGLGKAGQSDYGAAHQTHNELWIGDSIMGGCTGLGMPADKFGDTTRFDRVNDLVHVYGRTVSHRIGIQVAGTGLIRAQDGLHLDNRWDVGSGATANGSCRQLAAGGSGWMKFTSDTTGDIVRVVYYNNLGSGSPCLTVSLDGASSGTGYGTAQGPSTSKYEIIEISGVSVSVGSQVLITNISGSPIQLAAIEITSSAGGIAVHNFSCSGSRAYASWDTVSSGYSYLRQLTDTSVKGKYSFNVVHMGWGLFDASDPVPPTPAQIRTSLTTIASYFPSSTIVLHAMPEPGELAQAYPGRWVTYLAAYYQAADDLDCVLVDDNYLMGDGWTYTKPLGLTADNTAHYLPSGYATWGYRLAQVVS